MRFPQARFLCYHKSLRGKADDDPACDAAGVCCGRQRGGVSGGGAGAAAIDAGHRIYKRWLS